MDVLLVLHANSLLHELMLNTHNPHNPKFNTHTPYMDVLLAIHANSLLHELMLNTHTPTQPEVQYIYPIYGCFASHT